MTWTKDFQHALAHLDVNARLIVAGLSAEEMKQVDEIAFNMWHSDDPRVGVETIDSIVALAIFLVADDHVATTPKQTFH